MKYGLEEKFKHFKNFFKKLSNNVITLIYIVSDINIQQIGGIKNYNILCMFNLMMLRIKNNSY